MSLILCLKRSSELTKQILLMLVVLWICWLFGFASILFFSFSIFIGFYSLGGFSYSEVSSLQWVCEFQHSEHYIGELDSCLMQSYVILPGIGPPTAQIFILDLVKYFLGQIFSRERRQFSTHPYHQHSIWHLTQMVQAPWCFLNRHGYSS